MKILVICQYYYPEPFRITDICEELVKCGHEVMVVTGEPNYPEGEIYKGYENHKKSDEVINGVKVHRCPIVPRKTGTIYRMLNYFSYPFVAKKYIRSSKCVSSDDTSFDLVFVNQLSPVMMAEPAIAYKNKYHVPVLMYCLDLWPESLIAGGIKRNSPVYKLFHIISKKIYSKMDHILITSNSFKEYFVKEFSIDSQMIEYLPQYSEGLFEQTTVSNTEHQGVWNLMFAGNIGEIQSVDTILGAAERMKSENVHFHIVGGGTDLERLQGVSRDKQLKNVTFYGRQPLEKMPEFYSKADAMLITLKADPVLSLTLPGKMQSYMAAGKPIIGAIDGETRRIIDESKCGYCGSAEAVDELVMNIRRFCNCEDKISLCNNAKIYSQNNFDKILFFYRIEKCLKAVLNDSISNKH